MDTFNLESKQDAARLYENISIDSEKENYYNYHMMEHQPNYTPEAMYCCHDLDKCYILGFNTEQFYQICKERLLYTLDSSFQRTVYDVYEYENLSQPEANYQAMNLLYMYALGGNQFEPELLNKFYSEIDNTKKSKEYDIAIPLFESMITPKQEITLDNIHDVREDFRKKQVIAQQIRESAKDHNITWIDTPQTNSKLNEIFQNHQVNR